MKSVLKPVFKPVKIGDCSHDAYMRLVKSFHGSVAPGLLIGRIMVEEAGRHLPKEGFYDVVCETSYCLPDAVQLLTPCTVGNGWLKIVDLDRFALALYDKYTGEGIRVYLDPAKLEKWPAIRNWYLKLKDKKEQDFELLVAEITAAGSDLLGIQKAQVKPDLLVKRSKGAVAVCPLCGEAYPRMHGNTCRGCTGESPYRRTENQEKFSRPRILK